MKVSVEMDGLDRLQKIFERASNDSDARQALEQALFGVATSVLNESKKIVPVDTGNLRNSGRVDGPKMTSKGVEVEIVYGTGYAQIVHEDMTMDHSPSKLTVVTKRPRRGQAKFLEIPVMAAAPKFARQVTARYIRFFRRGG